MPDPYGLERLVPTRFDRSEQRLLCAFTRPHNAITTRIRLDLGDESLEQIKEHLGTRGKVETVDTTLQVAHKSDPRPRQRYVSTRELKAALAELPEISFEELRADTTDEDSPENKDPSRRPRSPKECPS